MKAGGLANRSCSVVRIGIVGFDQVPPPRQASLRAHLARLVNALAMNVGHPTCVIADCRDGAALCLGAGPQDALTAAATLRERLLADLQTGVFPAPVCIGIDHGSITLSADAHGRPIPGGEALAEAARVMANASPGQILVSRAFYEAVINAAPDSAELFRHAGLVSDPRGRECPLYALRASGHAADTLLLPDPPRPNTPNTQMISDRTGWERAELTAAAIALEPHVGARARELVMQAAERAASVSDLYRLLAGHIASKAARENFCRTQGIAPAPNGAGPAGARDAASRPPAADVPAATLDPALVQAAERELTLHLGPLARVLVRKHAQGHPSGETFLARLADELAGEDRARFLERLRKRGGSA